MNGGAGREARNFCHWQLPAGKRAFSTARGTKAGRVTRGSVLAEMLIALTVSVFFTGVLVQAVMSLQGAMAQWDRSLRMRQALSATLFCLSRDIRMAGCSPAKAPAFPGLEIAHDPDGDGGEVRIMMDKRGSEPGTRPDGDRDDPDEQIAYHRDPEAAVLRRNGQPVVTKIVDNPGGIPAFRLERGPGWGLVLLDFTIGREEAAMSLSTAVYVRNPM